MLRVDLETAQRWRGNSTLSSPDCRSRFLLLRDAHAEKETRIVYPDILSRLGAGDTNLACFAMLYHRLRLAMTLTGPNSRWTIQGSANPTSASNRRTAIKGSPTSAVGSVVSMAVHRLMPRPSHMKLPAQSSAGLASR